MYFFSKKICSGVAAEDGARALSVHVDDAEVTMNVCLGSDTFAGSLLSGCFSLCCVLFTCFLLMSR